MGLNATVYSDDTEECILHTIRIGNMAEVAELRHAIEQRAPTGGVILNSVLFSAFHTGDGLMPDVMPKLAKELEYLRKDGRFDDYVLDFLTNFSALVAEAMKLNRPIVF